MTTKSTSVSGPTYTIDYSLVCLDCGSENDESFTQSYCVNCGGVLEIQYATCTLPWQLPLPPSTLPDFIRSYHSPLKAFHRLSEKLQIPLYAKLESLNPSGSFKDRGTYIEVMKALQLGKKGIAVASTGNMAASVALYCHNLHLPCFVFVPKGTNPGKLQQAEAAGAKILEVEGDYSACEIIAMEYARENNLFLSGDYEFRLQGQKSFAYELLSDVPDMDFDYIVVPVGCGTNISAIGKGLTEMKALGLISSLPQLVGVQSEGASPLVASIVKGEKIAWGSASTIAQATAVSNPVDYPKVQRVLDQTDGFMLKVSEDDIRKAMQAQFELEGVFAEPSGCLPLAAVMSNPHCFRSANTLLVVTGHGLKDARSYVNSCS